MLVAFQNFVKVNRELAVDVDVDEIKLVSGGMNGRAWK